MDGTVLIADDDATIRTVLTQALTRAGCKVHATSSLTTLMRWIDEGRGDAVITDVRMPDGNGLEMLPKIARQRPGLPVIVISAQNTIMTAVQASEARAFDYLPKPFDLPDLMTRTARALEVGRGVRAQVDLPAPLEGEGPPGDLPLIGQAPVMQALFRVLARLMNADLPVLITGESGTGKSLIARTLHDLSDRRARPLVRVGPQDLTAADAPARLLDAAAGGSVVIEDIADFAPDAQAQLLRMMDAPGTSAPRFVATTQALSLPPPSLRADLYYRLGGAVIEVPPLRARLADIAPLASHALHRAEGAGAPALRLLPEALDRLRAHPWPGNVRELENTMRRIALTTRNTQITPEDVAAALTAPGAAHTAPATDESLSDAVARHLQRYFDLHDDALPPPGLHARVLREIEQPLIRIALDATGGNQARCADLLGINRNTLRKKIGDLDIQVTRRRKLM